MAKLYATLVMGGRWSIDRVPLRWREDVEAIVGA